MTYKERKSVFEVSAGWLFVRDCAEDEDEGRWIVGLATIIKD